MSTATLGAAVLIAVGLAGVVIPVLPGLVLVWAGIAIWAFAEGSAGGWLVLGCATAVLGLGLVLKYLLPGRRLREANVPWITLAFGVLLGVIGFFVIPVVGLPIGFVLGVYLAEIARLGSVQAAWPSTRAAVTAIGLSLMIELGAGLFAAAIWVGGLLLT
jgi:uncharacterized protein YqgC (DUF456 family)